MNNFIWRGLSVAFQLLHCFVGPEKEARGGEVRVLGACQKNDIDWYWGQPAIFLQTQVKRYQSERQDFWKVRLPTHLCVFNCGSKPLDPLLLLVKSGRPGLYHYRQFQAIKVLKHSNSDDNYGHCQHVNCCQWRLSLQVILNSSLIIRDVIIVINHHQLLGGLLEGKPSNTNSAVLLWIITTIIITILIIIITITIVKAFCLTCCQW